MPENEKQTRHLTGVPAPIAGAAWDAAVNGAGGRQPTSDKVRQAREELAKMTAAEIAAKVNASEAEAAQLQIDMKAKRPARTDADQLRIDLKALAAIQTRWSEAGWSKGEELVAVATRWASRKLARMQESASA